MPRYYTRDNLWFIYLVLLQALRVEIEMKYLNLQVTLLLQKGLGTRSLPTTPLTGTQAINMWPPNMAPCSEIIAFQTKTHLQESVNTIFACRAN